MAKDSENRVSCETFMQCYTEAMPSKMTEFAGLISDFHAVAMTKKTIAVGALALLAAKTEDAEERSAVSSLTVWAPSSCADYCHATCYCPDCYCTCS